MKRSTSDSSSKESQNKLLKYFNHFAHSKLLIIISLGVLVLVSAMMAGIQLTRQIDIAKAAPVYTCPQGGTLQGTNCVAANKNPAFYSCPTQTDTLAGDRCASTTTKANNYLHVAQCVVNNNGQPDYADILTRIVANNLSSTTVDCGGGRLNVENNSLNILSNRYMSYEFCESASTFAPDNHLTYVTRFLVGTTTSIANPCEGDASRKPIPGSGELPHLVDLYANQYTHVSYCQAIAQPQNIITRVTTDNDPTAYNTCAGDSVRQMIEQPFVLETGWQNSAATLNPAACPTGWTDAGGNNCQSPATYSAYEIDNTSTGNSTDCTATKTVTIGQTYTCTFPLTGSQNNVYSLPASGITASTSTATGTSQPCTILNNGTAQATMQCTGIPTSGATAGVQNVLVNGQDKGDVNLVPAFDPNGDNDGDGITNGTECNSTGTNCPDTDGDGTPDLNDTDSDGDGIPDSKEKDCSTGVGTGTPCDTDGDGTPDYRDTDSDGDGIPDSTEKGSTCATLTNCTPTDTDGDGIPDYRDTDSDGDGIPDSKEKGTTCATTTNCTPVDTDTDGKPDYQDGDSDGDTIPDSVEKGSTCTTLANCTPVDTDGDGKPNYTDLDSDGDGVKDQYEAGSTPSSPRDTDGDGKQNYVDTDDDNDGKPTNTEQADPNGDGNDADAVDVDKDGIVNYLDPSDLVITNTVRSGGAQVLGIAILAGVCAAVAYIALNSKKKQLKI
jgi:hypothetical protein